MGKVLIIDDEKQLFAVGGDGEAVFTLLDRKSVV